jgi:hypothetical protein
MVTFVASISVVIFLSVWVLAIVTKFKEDSKPKKRRRRR